MFHKDNRHVKTSVLGHLYTNTKLPIKVTKSNQIYVAYNAYRGTSIAQRNQDSMSPTSLKYIVAKETEILFQGMSALESGQ